MQIPVSTYSANRGFAWSNVPKGVTKATLNALGRLITTSRGFFPNPLSVEMGLVSNGKIAAAFTLQNVEHWDAEDRNSDYVAVALFPVEDAAEIDFIQLLNHDFFWTASREPIATLTYDGPKAQQYPKELATALEFSGRTTLTNPRAIGALLADLGAHSGSWICRLQEGNIFDITCNPWNSKKEQKK